MTGDAAGEVPVGPQAVGLHALVVDPDESSRTELADLLAADGRLARVRAAAETAAAIRILSDETVDVVFCEITLPGLDGIEFARMLTHLMPKPQIVFVTGRADRAADAFDVGATDFVRKPLRSTRLSTAVSRVADRGGGWLADEVIPVELGGRTRFIRRSEVRYAEAHGDYTRLYTATGSHLIRMPLSELEHRWAPAGFVRIHRSTLVALNWVDEVRADQGHYRVRAGGTELSVSRRHTHELRRVLAELSPARSGR